MLVNLTNHPINIYSPASVHRGVVIDVAIPATVILPTQELRAMYDETVYLLYGIPVKRNRFLCFNQIEIPQEGSVIVSFRCVAPLKEQFPNLKIYTVDGIVKNSDGEVVGCTCLVEN